MVILRQFYFSPLSANVLIDFSGSRYNCGIVQSDGTEADTSPYLFQLYITVWQLGPIERSTGKNSSYISSSAAMKPPRSILKTCLMSSISNRGFPIFFSLFSKDLHFIYLRHLKEQLSSSVLRKVTNYIPFSVIGYISHSLRLFAVGIQIYICIRKILFSFSNMEFPPMERL